jgi:hypothetical protein
LNELFTGPLEPAHVATLRALWKRELQRYMGEFPCTAINAPCCAQFLVRSERLRAVPLDAWRALLNVAMGRQALEFVPDKDPAANNLHITGAKWEDVRQMEFLWHVLLGEPCVSPVTDALAYENAAFDERPLLKAASRPAGVWRHVCCFSDAPDDGRVMGVHGELNYHGTHVRTPRGCKNMALDH